MSRKLLTVENIRCSYDEKEILKGVTFDAEENSVVSILGPNGVGKTTLLKCICNIIKPSSGNVTISGYDVKGLRMRELAKHIAYVPQYVERSNIRVFDSVLIGRRPYIEWSTTKNDLELTWSALESLKIGDLASRFVDEISGGEYQKVQIARAIVQEPELLILDEPTNNLDISNQHITMHTIINAVRSRGMCTLMTMHDINLAVHYSDKFIFVKDGTVISQGGPEIITEELIEEVYGVRSDVIIHKGKPFVIPHPLPVDMMHIHHQHGGEMHSHDVSDE